MEFCLFETIPILNAPDVVSIQTCIGKNVPFVCRSRSLIEQWPASRWSPTELKKLFPNLKTTARFYPLSVGKSSVVAWEASCQSTETTVGEFCDWIMLATQQHHHKSLINTDQNTTSFTQSALSLSSSSGSSSSSTTVSNIPGYSPLAERFPVNSFWGYMDYKHFEVLFAGMEHADTFADFSVFGLDLSQQRSQPALWFGSAGANTPCHMDTYGYNLVAQIFGCKKWVLFPPSDSQFLYPTRIPYEESSVYSPINVFAPDLERFPEFLNATQHHAELSAGDVLYVPNHWWHHALHVEPSISVNMWVDLPSDSVDRVKEAVVRTVISTLKSAEHVTDDKNWLNPNEEHWDHQTCLDALRNALIECVDDEDAVPSENADMNNMLVNCLTGDNIVQRISEQLLRDIQKNSHS
jgi:HSPB1-associated protein 1